MSNASNSSASKSNVLKRPVILISYARTDEPGQPAAGDVKWFSFVRPFLEPAGVIDPWEDRQMTSGAAWEQELEAKLRACDVFVLLVSAYSMASTGIVDRAIAIIRERQAKGEPVQFYPLLLKWTPGLEKLKDGNLRPRNATPLWQYNDRDRDREMTDIANEIAAAAANITKQKQQKKRMPQTSLWTIAAAVAVSVMLGLAAFPIWDYPKRPPGPEPSPQEGSAGELRAFVGKRPFDVVKGRDLFEVPGVRVLIERLLGARGLEAIKRMYVTPPVEEHLGWLVASGCDLYTCLERWTLAIDLANYNMFVCLGVEGRRVRYAAAEGMVVRRSPGDNDPCPKIPNALNVFRRLFPPEFDRP
jgi:hypothetical protein